MFRRVAPVSTGRSETAVTAAMENCCRDSCGADRCSISRHVEAETPAPAPPAARGGSPRQGRLLPSPDHSGARRSCRPPRDEDSASCGECEDGEEAEGRPAGAGSQSKEQLTPPPEQQDDLHLPRSSPVISRRSRGPCWQSGGTSTSADRSPPGRGDEPLATCVAVEPSCSGRQKLTGEQRGRSLDDSGVLLRAAQPRRDRLRFSSVLDLSAAALRSSCELEQENAHFVVVDMVLEALEAVKWTLSCDGCPSSKSSLSPGQEARKHREKLQNKTEGGPSVPSADGSVRGCGVDATPPPPPPTEPLSSAEQLAQRLVLDFRSSWLPSDGPRRGRLSLRSSLQEMPGTDSVAAAASGSSLHEEIRQRTRMRGDLNWAPPRLQIIVTLQPPHRRSEAVAAQHFLCAGCGTEVEPRYIKKLRYCDYLGRYFCDCCHGGAEAVIPARVLSFWDFSRRPVSHFSKQLLDSLWPQPLFELSRVGGKLLGGVRELRRFKELQEQLAAIKKLLTTCRLSRRVLAEIEHLPPHLTELPLLVSMDDLWRVKKGQLLLRVRALLDVAVFHVENCELCLARGFICEFCRGNDVIFPFQSLTCKRCSVCKACFHKHCFTDKKCPKCTRIQSQKVLSEDPGGATAAAPPSVPQQDHLSPSL